MLTLLLVGTFILGFKVQPVKAATITVPDDYSTIQAAINAANSGDTVFVKAGTYNEQVFINKSISLIGENRGTTIINEPSEVGDVVIIQANGVLISNFTINGYKEPEPAPPPNYWVDEQGIINEGYNDTAIVNIDVTNGGNALAIEIRNANNITLTGCSITGNIRGVLLSDCSNITLINNNVNYNWGYSGWGSTRTGYGIFLDHCYNATMRGNSMQGNGDDFAIDGEEIDHFLHDIDTSNLLINGTTRKMYYLINQHNEDINLTGYPELGFLALVNSTGINVQGFDLVDNTPGVLLAYTNDSVVTNNTIRYCTRGISLVHSSNNTVYGNTFAPNNTDSIDIKYFSTNNTIADNSVRDNTGLAMQITNSSQNIISNNNVTSNLSGGIYMRYADNNTLLGNNVTNSGDWAEGIRLQYSCNNTLRNNLMQNNSVNFRVVATFDTELSQFTHDVDPSNLVDGKHIYYLINYTGTNVNPATYPDAGFLALVNSTNITAEDLELQGMLVGYTNNSLIQGNTIRDGGDSITMVKSSGNTLTENVAANTTDGISLWDYSKNNTISLNNVTDVGNHGIGLRYSENNTITGNRVGESNAGISVDDYSSNAIVTRNLAFNNSFGGIEVEWDSSFCTITENNATGNHYGILLSSNTNNTVVKNDVTGSEYYGIRIDFSGNNTVSGNNIRDSGHGGVALRYDSSNNTIAGNDIRNSTVYGIQFYILSTNNTVVGNNITDSGQDGINIDWSGLNLISGNNIANSTRDGIHVEGYLDLDPEYTITIGSMNNSITWNNVTQSGRYGIYMEAYNNTIHHNRFTGYTDPTFSDADHPNIWDDGYPSGGNYWSSYVGVDLYHGPLQNILGGDGIGDTPYAMNENNTDHYPIMYDLPYTATISAHCDTEATDITIAITMDSVSSGYNTPHSFANLEGTHTFTVPSTDSSGHAFKQWSTGQTSTTITVSSGGTYTAYYEATPPQTYSVTINAHCNTEGAATNVAITMDGSPTGHSTPYTFTGLTGTHTVTVPNTDTMGHPFKQWNTGETTTTITVTGSTTRTAYYEAATPEPSPSYPVGGRIVSADSMELLASRLVSSAPTIIGTVAIAIAITIIGILILRKKQP